jgi:hypothetical protein
MGQIVSWSVRDESLHCEGITKLFHAFVAERGCLTKAVKEDIIDCCQKTVRLEDAFIDLAFEQGPVPGMSPKEIKKAWTKLSLLLHPDKAAAVLGAEAGEAELGEGDLAVGERFAEGEATGPIEGLGHGDGPSGAFTGEGAGGGVDAFLAKRSGERGIGQGAGGAGLRASGGDLGFVKSQFRMLCGDGGDESVD